MNRLYPNSRRESSNENQYLSPQGEDGGRSGQTKTRQSTLRGQEWRSARKGGLNSPKTRSRTKRNRNREAAGFFFFAAGMKKENGDYKTELAAGTSVELGASFN
ncbi:hypothetical protein TNCV_118021 [Trichonephila clavipes]|nr:hypothetical protein TNCV_118021 [Trichonephila clavipes]